MKRIFILLLVLAPFAGNAQIFEMGILGGGSSYLGDLSEVAFTAKETSPAIGAFMTLNFNPFIGLRGNVQYGRIAGDDNNSSRAYANLRNLSFKSDIYEAAILVEFNLTGYNPKRLQERFSPYVVTGISIFNFNPKAFYQGQWYDLQPLGTEGQGTSAFPEREPYKLTQVGVPLGGGVKIALTEKWNLGAEVRFTKTFTDYLDDVSSTYVDSDVLIAENGILSYNLSNRTGEFLNTEPLDWDETVQRGDSSDKDWFIFASIRVSRNYLRSPFGSGAVKCPAFN